MVEKRKENKLKLTYFADIPQNAGHKIYEKKVNSAQILQFSRQAARQLRNGQNICLKVT